MDLEGGDGGVHGGSDGVVSLLSQEGRKVVMSPRRTPFNELFSSEVSEYSGAFAALEGDSEEPSAMQVLVRKLMAIAKSSTFRAIAPMTS